MEKKTFKQKTIVEQVMEEIKNLKGRRAIWIK